MTDPHYTTFDGRRYDFHGLGYYTVMEVISNSNNMENILFTLQAGHGHLCSQGHQVCQRTPTWNKEVAFGQKDVASFHVSSFLILKWDT